MMFAMRTSLACLVFATLAACGGGDTPATTPQPEPEPESAAPTCASASAHAVTELTSMEGPFTDEQKAELEVLFATSCAEDEWPEEAIRCVAESTGEELERCETLIPEETHQRVGAEIERILGAGHKVDDAEPPPPTP
jgi:hypothetical protein